MGWLTVIMPVYNTGKYLEESLQSIYAQTFKDFDVVCVDDASDDGLTIRILQKYQREHENFTLIRSERNLGAAQARNLGIQKAQGEYVVFLDADDVFLSRMFETAYKRVIEVNAEVCVFGYKSFYICNGEKKYLHRTLPADLSLIDKNSEERFCYYITNPHKLCKKSFLQEQDIFFQSISSSNDVFFSCMALTKAEKTVYITDEHLYEYRTNTPMQISSNRNPGDILLAVKLLEDKFQENGELDELRQRQIMAFLMRHFLMQVKECKQEKLKREAYILVQKYLKEKDTALTHKLFQDMYKSFTGEPYESKWFDNMNIYFEQLKFDAAELKQALQERNKIFLWGMGERGKGFLQFCQEEGIGIRGTVDIRNIDIGKKTIGGCRICHTDEALGEADMIVASNSGIYQELQKVTCKTVVNLEKYCPIN